MLSFIATPEFFVPQLARHADPERRSLPILREASDLPIRVNLRPESDAPCGARVLVEEDLERWDGLS
jgi:hypothetical protein